MFLTYWEFLAVDLRISVLQRRKFALTVKKRRKDDSDFLDDLLEGIEGMFPNTGEDWSTYICEEGQSGQTLPPTKVVISGGIQIPDTNPIIRYTIDDVIVKKVTLRHSR